MRVLLTGGGTGGHVYPALAIAEIIKSKAPDAEIAFVGTKVGVENRIVPAAGYKLYWVDIQGIKRSLSPKNIKTAYLVLTSPREAAKILDEFRPDVVIGTGGYACWPLLEAATKKGIPTVVHESNSIPGLAVKVLKNKLDLVLTNFAETAEKCRVRKKIIAVGNPVRTDCASYTRDSARDLLGIDKNKFMLVTVGGSRGAEGMNFAALEIMSSFTSKHSDVIHYHVYGKDYSDVFPKAFADEKHDGYENIRIFEYLDDMPKYMAAADLIVCRGGAMTLSELAALGKAAVILPSPNVTADHQYKNAKTIADKDGAIVVREEKNATRDSLSCREASEAVERVYSDAVLRKRLSENIRAFATPDAGERIFKEIVSLIESKK